MPLLLTVKTDSSCQLLVVMQSHVGNSKTDNHRLSCTRLGRGGVASGRTGTLKKAAGHIPAWSCWRSKGTAPRMAELVNRQQQQGEQTGLGEGRAKMYLPTCSIKTPGASERLWWLYSTDKHPGTYAEL